MKKLHMRLALHRETLLALDSSELDRLRGGAERRSDSSRRADCVSECAPSAIADFSCCAASCDDWLM